MSEFDDDDYDEDVEYYAVRPNKTQIKKDIAELFKLGETLSELPLSTLKNFELPEHIHKSISEVAGMPLTGARKRLLKYIAAQFHKMDVSDIQEKLAKLQNQSAHAVREHHLVERWRERLLNEGDEALTELRDQQPALDVQQLRQLLRNIHKEAQTGKPPKSSRQLYRYLKDLFDKTLDEASSDE